MRRRFAACAAILALSGVATALAISVPATASLPHHGKIAVKTIAVTSKFHPGVRLEAPRMWRGKHVKHYQWERCGARGRGCVAIRGATHRVYRITRRDVGHTIAVRMTVGSVIVQTSPTGVVQPNLPLPVNTALPTISDTTSGNVNNVTEGDALSGTLGTWTGAADYAWAWQSCTPQSAICTTVASGGPTTNAGATPAYTVQHADVGDTIVLVVTAYNTVQ